MDYGLKDAVSLYKRHRIFAILFPQGEINMKIYVKRVVVCIFYLLLIPSFLLSETSQSSTPQSILGFYIPPDDTVKGEGLLTGLRTLDDTIQTGQHCSFWIPVSRFSGDFLIKSYFRCDKKFQVICLLDYKAIPYSSDTNLALEPILFAPREKKNISIKINNIGIGGHDLVLFVLDSHSTMKRVYATKKNVFKKNTNFPHPSYIPTLYSRKRGSSSLFFDTKYIYLYFSTQQLQGTSTFCIVAFNNNRQLLFSDKEPALFYKVVKPIQKKSVVIKINRAAFRAIELNNDLYFLLITDPYIPYEFPVDTINTQVRCDIEEFIYTKESRLH